MSTPLLRGWITRLRREQACLNPLQSIKEELAALKRPGDDQTVPDTAEFVLSPQGENPPRAQHRVSETVEPGGRPYLAI